MTPSPKHAIFHPMRTWVPLLALLLVWTSPASARAADVAFLGCESDSLLIQEAIKGLELPSSVTVEGFSHADMEESPSASKVIENAPVIIVDVMISEWTDHLIKNVSLEEKRIYAIRTSRDDEALEEKGFLFVSEVAQYFDHLTTQNIRNLIRRVIHREIDDSLHFGPVQPVPESGVYHPKIEPEAGRKWGSIFESCEAYMKWYRSRPGFDPEAPWIGLALFSSSIIRGQSQAVDALALRLEEEGWNILPAFGRDQVILERYFLSEAGRSRIDLVVAFSLKFHSALNEAVAEALGRLNVPIINAIHPYFQTFDEWRRDPRGIMPREVVWTLANPEISGLMEPSVLSGKVKERDPSTGRIVFVHKAIEENIELLIPRIRKWLRLQREPNESKRVAILYYNNSQGKQNIGASYLNVFNSLDVMLARMETEGYEISGEEALDTETIRDMILKGGRNVGSWAPGELERMVREAKVVKVPMETYREWFQGLPEAFRRNVIDQWGLPEDSKMMVHEGAFILPVVQLGNVCLMPEPARGWGDDAQKLYHDPILYPHHQYIAAYLWLERGFRAGAMVHLGTHATHEWLPGKQAGLSIACPPEVLITDIPNIYPYIVDDVGEGIQAKRRGRAVIIDHLTPAIKEAGLYEEYSRLYDLLNQYRQARAMGSDTVPVQREEMEAIIRETGISKDLGIERISEESLVRVENYLAEIRTNFMPYGLHTFGISPQGEALQDTVKCVLKRNAPSDVKGSTAIEDDGQEPLDPAVVEEKLAASGPRELDHYMKALRGRYIPAGEGNDPMKNPQAIPTGKNFYGYDPAKIPSRQAYELGARAAQGIIEKSLRKKDRYPEKVAVVLWATETIRNEGVNEGTILHLMGMKPRWDRSGRVTGVEAIPGKELGRPRLDVLINPSGLYRDLFPNLLLYLDEAVQQASVQRDVENLIRRNSERLRKQMVEQGMAPEEAERLAGARIFGEPPGGYGTGVSEMTSASGLWESPEQVGGVFETRTGFAFGGGLWGREAKTLLKEHLKDVDTAVHSISSNVYGTMDNDDLFQYLGGLSLAVQKERGEAPDTLITMQRESRNVQVEDIAKTLGREMRSRYLNPQWMEGMKKEGYAGAREMNNFVEYLWGWQVTTPFAVDDSQWQQVYEVYVEDKYDQDLEEFFTETNPWAYQSMTARMLETVRKGYWEADEAVQQRLAVEYAMNVVAKGVACCDHTCNNPVLNQMVVQILSIPGVMSPEMVEQFKVAVEQAADKDLAEQVKERKDLLQKLQAPSRRQERKEQAEASKQPSEAQEKASGKEKDLETVEGYKMEKMAPEQETETSSSGVQWMASVLIFFMIALLALGMGRAKNR